MEKMNELVSKIDNPELRLLIEQELSKIQNKHKFGLVFEEHSPECTPLYDIPVKRGNTVAVKAGKISENYLVTKIEGNTATCEKLDGSHTICEFDKDELVVVAQFGEPIYPFLQKIDSVQNSTDNDLWHTLIEADNYNALQLMVHLYAGKVDCIYIDPPYNTGAKDWKYNNRYVDYSDSYRHSTWLSMMEKRLRLAKTLLNPKDSVLIVTIDEKEYLHLGCLLEQLFPKSRMQMISTVINRQGVSRDHEFARVNEYIFFVMMGKAHPERLPLSKEWLLGSPKIMARKEDVYWSGLLRRGTDVARKYSPGCFYPIVISKKTNRIVYIGKSGETQSEVDSKYDRDSHITCYPIRPDNSEGHWQLSAEKFKETYELGYVKFGKPNERQGVTLYYLSRGERLKIERGIFKIVGRDPYDNSVLLERSEMAAEFPANNQWSIASHDSSQYGTILNKKFLCDHKFTYPKSLYAVHDAIKFFITNKPDAMVVDFFAGSGTTMHAVNLLNAEDGGHRRCVLVTNNEVSDEEVKELTQRGFRPGDKEWERYGVARYITWPRTVCSIKGFDVNGQPVKGNYMGLGIPMADGFKANAIYFKLGYCDKTKVSPIKAFSMLLPLLWMKAGSQGICQTIKAKDVPDMLIYPENRFAILNTESSFSDFADKVNAHPEIETAFIITNSEDSYKEFVKHLNVKHTFLLSRDYLENFRINQPDNQ